MLSSLKQLFEMILKTLNESIILFDNEYYSQGDVVLLDSPWSNISKYFFVCHYCLALKKNAQKSQPKLLEKSCRLYFCAF